MTTLDDHGTHIMVCRRGGVMAGAKWRHNAFVRDLAMIAHEAGFNGVVHDGPVFTVGRRTRPADFLQSSARHPAGEAIDATIGADDVMGPDARELLKEDLYRPQLIIHPHLGFRPFAVTTGGAIGLKAWSVCGDWMRGLAARRIRERLPAGDAHGETMTAVARAFTRCITDQIRAWSGAVT